MEQSIEHYNGPLPPPKLLAEFEVVVPGSAERIIANMERESAHRREIESKDSQAGRDGFFEQLKYRGRGQWMAFAITMFALGISGLAMWKGHEASGAIIGTASLVTIVIAFIKGAPDSKDEMAIANRPQAK